MKKAEKELTSLKAKKAKADAKADEEAKRVEVEAALKKLLVSGVSADEILEKLKQNNKKKTHNSVGKKIKWKK